LTWIVGFNFRFATPFLCAICAIGTAAATNKEDSRAIG